MKGWLAGAASLALLLFVAGRPAAQTVSDPLAWAFPASEPPSTREEMPERLTLPGVDRSFSAAEFKDHFNVADWRPDEHPAAPAVVMHGRAPDVVGCAYCHLATGQGLPANAPLAGLPRDYIVQQVRDMASGARGVARSGWTPSVIMHAIAHAMRPEEIEAAADYFSKLPARSHVRVIECDTIPAMTTSRNAYRPLPGAGTEPLGLRIVETPDDFGRYLLKDSALRFTAYVPTGSIERGRKIAQQGTESIAACSACHGAALEGGLGPHLAGTFPTLIVRQLNAFRTGIRNGPTSEPMREVAARMKLADMIDVAAYAASMSRPAPSN